VTDPYRDGSMVATCPRCRGELAGDGELRLVCLAGCGEWYPRELLAHRVAWDVVVRPVQVDTWPWSPAECPGCHEPMATAFREELRFDHCGQHGVWLDAGEAERFFALFARPRIPEAAAVEAPVVVSSEERAWIDHAALASAWHLATGARPAGQLAERCPVCTGRLVRRTLSYSVSPDLTTEIVFGLCAQHGVSVARGELATLYGALGIDPP
jgi:Zn-finger nucleic acid-binding protein